MSAELRVERLRKVFATGAPAVDDVSFSVGAGEIVALLGPSGCGKTTTLRCVAGLEHPSAGKIRIAGATVSAPDEGVLVAPRARNIGMVFQSYAVWPHMTVEQNVAYPLRQRRAARAEIERRTAEILKLVGLSDFARRPVVSLSGGQMQRVALARSLVYEPALLLLDEPLSNLDANLRLRLRDDLRRIIKRTGVTALYVTHDQAEAAVLGDRDGEMGTIEAPSGHRFLAWLPPRVVAGAAVKIAVRPENVRFGDGGGEPGSNRFTARVLVQRYEGAQTVYSLAVLGGKLAALELGSSARYAVDSEVDIVLPPTLCWAYPDEEDAVAK